MYPHSEALILEAANLSWRGSGERHPAAVDPTTGVHSRRWLDTALPRQIALSIREQSPLALLIVEIDHAAEYRAEFGDEARDRALYATAQTMLNSVRPTDSVVRYDAARFAVLVPQADVAGARVVAERVRRAIGAAGIMMSDKSVLPSVTVSIGVAEFDPFADAEELLAAGEHAVEVAQADGYDRVCTAPLAAFAA